MAGAVAEDSGVGKSVEGVSSGQSCQSSEALAEWRSSEQVENGTPSTSPPYWDTDEDDDGLKPSELYGKYTWKIEKFSQITKRELRSNAFEVGNYKWYILIYPQGCDVCNHLSLFLCVANHDKLLPGWSHFAQFTIAVVNKDPKKSKYSDTLHRFWKKEHDWGWKKFMELSKVYDGFVDNSDNLIIKAQVQVIREKADRPFRCLDCQYRRELVRVYLTNVEQICRRFVEERRSKLGKLIEDKARWSSFCSFWLGIEQNSRRRMSREKTDVILKAVVKHFFIEKEVTSTLVMDSLYSGLKALEGQSTKSKKNRIKLLDAEEVPAPIVCVEKEMFVLVDDVLRLLERAAVEPLPPKDEKGPQNRTKDGNSGEDFNKDSIERDERRLTELGRRTVEIFVLAHIFSSKIEVAYQEAVALKRQEELIREEEAAWQAGSEQKARRGVNEKEKKSKKKQTKQKRNNRKGKDKLREERPIVAVNEKNLEDGPLDEKKDSIIEDMQSIAEKPDILEDVSDISDSVDGVTEAPQPDSEDRDAILVNWDTDASEVHPPTEASSNGITGLSSGQNSMTEKKGIFVMDDSSSTCSTDSVPSVVINAPYNQNTLPSQRAQKSPSRGKNQQGKSTSDGVSWSSDLDIQPSNSALDAVDANEEIGSSKVGESECEGAEVSSQDTMKSLDHDVMKKEEDSSLRKKISNKEQVGIHKEKTTAVSPPTGSPRSLPSSVSVKVQHQTSAIIDNAHVRTTSSSGSQQSDKDASATCTSASPIIVPRTETLKTATVKGSERSPVPVLTRPSSAPLVPGPRPSAPVVSMVQTAPPIPRSVSAVGRLSPDTSATHSYVPLSYRNVMMGNSVASTAASLPYSSNSSTSVVNSSPGFSQSPSLASSSSIFMPDSNAGQKSVPFGMANRDVLQNGPQWIERPQREATRSLHYDPPSSPLDDVQNFGLYNLINSRSLSDIATEYPACTSGRQNTGLLADDFPHLDIINDLLDDEYGIGDELQDGSVFPSHGNGLQSLNRQYTFPNELGARDDLGTSTTLNRHYSFPNELGTRDNLGTSTSFSKFERSQSYHEHRFQRGYNPSSLNFDTARDYIPQGSTLSYLNGQVDGLIQNQWQMAGSDMPYLGMRNTENDGYPYYPTDYSNMSSGANGYTMYRPPNGP